MLGGWVEGGGVSRDVPRHGQHIVHGHAGIREMQEIREMPEIRRYPRYR